MKYSTLYEIELAFEKMHKQGGTNERKKRESDTAIYPRDVNENGTRDNVSKKETK